MIVDIVTSNRTYRIGILGEIVDLFSDANTAGNDIDYLIFSGAVLADMDAGDTARVIVLLKGPGADGTSVGDLQIRGRDGSNMSHFSGYKAM